MRIPISPPGHREGRHAIDADHREQDRYRAQKQHHLREAPETVRGLVHQGLEGSGCRHLFAIHFPNGAAHGGGNGAFFAAKSYHQGVAKGLRGPRPVKERAIGGAEALRFHVARHSRHFQWLAARRLHRLADGVAAGEECSCECLGYDDGSRIARAKGAAAQQG